jgi:hypothetical protein
MVMGFHSRRRALISGVSLPLPVLRERAGVRVHSSRPRHKTLTLTLPEYREREQYRGPALFVGNDKGVPGGGRKTGHDVSDSQ